MKTRHKVRLPDLSCTAQAVHDMRPIVIVQQAAKASQADAMHARIRELEATVVTLTKVAVARAQREERIKPHLIREHDGRADWYAKQPKARPPIVAIHSQRIITADTWQLPVIEE